jgi:hypothetical protein
MYNTAMFNLFKKTPCFEFYPIKSTLQNTPIIPAKKYQPNWWKRLHVNSFTVMSDNRKPQSSGTIKKCPGFIDIINSGWIIPAWCDISIEVTKENTYWEFSDDDYNGAAVHSRDQFLSHIPQSAQNQYICSLKVKSPWMVKGPSNYKLLITTPFFFFNEYFDTAWGILQTDIYHEFNIFLLLKKEGSFVIERGTPLCLLYPIKDKSPLLKIMPVDSKVTKELQEKTDFIARSKFCPLITYREKQREQQNKKKKCPFSFFNKEP